MKFRVEVNEPNYFILRDDRGITYLVTKPKESALDWIVGETIEMRRRPEANDPPLSRYWQRGSKTFLLSGALYTDTYCLIDISSTPFEAGRSTHWRALVADKVPMKLFQVGCER